MRALILICLITAAPFGSHARTWIVDSAGGGDFQSVLTALQAASGGDSILVRPGVYDEYDGPDVWVRVTEAPLTLLGGGEFPEETSLRLSVQFHFVANRITIENLRFFGEASPILCEGPLTVRRCLFEDNESTGSGGGAIRGSGSLLVEDSVFKNNRSIDPTYELDMGGAISFGGTAEILRCTFWNNSAGNRGGAIEVASSLTMEDCIFIGNRADHGAAVSASDVERIANCTFLSNEVTNGQGAALEAFFGAWDLVSHSIVARTVNGWGVGCDSAEMFQCCDVWGNERGDYGGAWCMHLEEDGNFSSDPVFCDWEAGNVGLQEGSPCVPGQHGGATCGLIGAKGLECPGTAIESISWGKVRGMFR